MAQPMVIIRQVWQYNLDFEFNLIRLSLSQFPYISMDTEFPGTIFNPFNISSLPPQKIYSVMKKNVDKLKIIQLGMTLADAHGNLPQFGTKFCYVWQFNFRDFDCERDAQNPESISLLTRQGMNFTMNKCYGVDSRAFAFLYKQSNLGRSQNQTCITFHGLYDFGFMIKVLTGKQLPNKLEVFMVFVELYFGVTVYDLKPMARELGLHGSLEKVATKLNVKRVVGRSHQAGADSLLGMQVFMELKKNNSFTTSFMDKFNHQLYGVSVIP